MIPSEPSQALIPVALITGFLGSGKTTLLKGLLSDPRMRDTAVVINEFGDVGLDHLLVAASSEAMVEMNGGCLCCTIRSDLADTLRSLFLKRVRGEVMAFRRVVIETTGLADPAPIIHTLIHDPLIAARFRLDSVIATVDAVNGAGTLDRQQEAVKQAAMADRIVVTKVDLAAPETVQALKARLRELNPAAPMQLQGDPLGGGASLNPDLLFGASLFDPAKKTLDVRGWLAAEAYQQAEGEHACAPGCGHDHHHDHHHHHHHDHGHAEHAASRHDDGIRSFCITRDRPISATALTIFLEMLVASRGADLLRVKGLLDIAEHPGRAAVIHGVQHVFHPVAWLDSWPDSDRRSRIVFITRRIPSVAIEKLLDALDLDRQLGGPATAMARTDQVPAPALATGR